MKAHRPRSLGSSNVLTRSFLHLFASTPCAFELIRVYTNNQARLCSAHHGMAGFGEVDGQQKVRERAQVGAVSFCFALPAQGLCFERCFSRYWRSIRSTDNEPRNLFFFNGSWAWVDQKVVGLQGVSSHIPSALRRSSGYAEEARDKISSQSNIYKSTETSYRVQMVTLRHTAPGCLKPIVPRVRPGVP